MKKLIFFASLILSISAYSQKTIYDFLIIGQEKMYQTNPPDYSGAIRNFNKALKEDPNFADAYLERGNAYSLLGNYTKAIEDITSAISKFSKDDDDDLAVLYCYRGVFYYKNKDVKNALNDFTKAEEYGCNNGELYKLRGNIFLEKKKIKEALSDYKLALPFFQNIKDNKNIFELYQNLGLCEYKLFNTDKAFNYFNKALDIDSSNVFCLNYRSILYYLKGYNYKALEDLNYALEKDSNNIFALYMRGFLNYFYFEDRISADRDFNKVLLLDDKKDYSLYISCINNDKDKINQSMYELITKSKEVKASNYYYIARIYSLSFHEVEAINYLDSALCSGFIDYKKIQTIDPGFKNIRYKESFKNLLKKYNINYSSQQPNIEVLNKIEYYELIANEPPKLSIELRFEDLSKNNKIEGSEPSSIVAVIKNIGKGIAWCSNLKLIEKNNSASISYDKEMVINKILPQQIIEKRFNIKSKGIILDTLIFHFELNNSVIGQIHSADQIVYAKPNIDITQALLLPVDSVVSIDLSYRSLSEVPNDILKLSKLEYLNLSNNRLKKIDNLSFLKNLKYINLSNNDIENLPPGVCELSNLTSLLIGENQLTYLPENLNKLSNLKTLELKNNRLKQFDPSIAKLKHLKDLDLSGNKINEIPSEISYLSDLENLVLSDCDIHKCSPELYKLVNLKTLYLNGNDYFSNENIIDLRLILNKTYEIYYSEQFTKNCKLIDPIPNKDFSKVKDLWAKCQNGDYKAMVKLGDYFDMQNQYSLAEIMYSKAIISASKDNFQNFADLGDHFDDKGYSTYAEKAFRKTLDFSINDYLERMRLAYDLYNRNFIDIATEHYSKIVSDYNYNNDTVIYELAKFFEVDRSLYSLAIEMYEKISENPNNYGTGKDLIAKNSIIEFCERHPDFSYKKSLFDLNKEICSTIPKDENALAIVKSSCKKCWQILDKTIDKKEKLFEKKKKKAEQIVKAGATAKKVGALAGMASSLVSSIPGASSAGSIASSAVQAGNMISGLAQENAYNRIKADLEKLSEEIEKLKKEQKSYVDVIPSIGFEEQVNTEASYDVSVTWKNNRAFLNVSAKTPILIKYDTLDFYYIKMQQTIEIPVVDKSRKLFFYDFKNYKKDIIALGEDGQLKKLTTTNFSSEINSKKTDECYYVNSVKRNSYTKMNYSRYDIANKEKATVSNYTTIILNQTKFLNGKSYVEVKSFSDGLIFVCKYDGIEFMDQIYDTKKMDEGQFYFLTTGLPIGTKIHQSTSSVTGKYEYTRNYNTINTFVEKIPSISINNVNYQDVIKINYFEEGEQGNKDKLSSFKTEGYYLYAKGFGILKGNTDYYTKDKTYHTDFILTSSGDTNYKPMNIETGTFTDPRDNRIYKTVKIGNQTWMAENLHYKCNGSYDYKSYELSNKYGYLYKYTAFENACPTGWHIPSEKEWMVLIDLLGGTGVAGGQLKETGSENWDEKNINNADNSSGFSARGGGWYSADILFHVREYGKFWTSETTHLSIFSGFKAVLMDKRVQKNDKHHGNGFQYYDYLSIRCIKD